MLDERRTLNDGEPRFGVLISAENYGSESKLREMALL